MINYELSESINVQIMEMFKVFYVGTQLKTGTKLLNIRYHVWSVKSNFFIIVYNLSKYNIMLKDCIRTYLNVLLQILD